MKTLNKKIEYEYLSEYYFGLGFGITKIDGKTLIILPFVVVMIIEKEVYR